MVLTLLTIIDLRIPNERSCLSQLYPLKRSCFIFDDGRLFSIAVIAVLRLYQHNIKTFFEGYG